MLAAMERAWPTACRSSTRASAPARQWPQYPTAQASTRLVNKGVVMVASIGNNGPGGSSPDALYAAGAPGVGAKVIGVASFDNAQQLRSSSNGTPYGYNAATGAPSAPTSGSAADGADRHADDHRRRLRRAAARAASTGTVALIRRGTCSFYIKAINAQTAGAAAVVLYNNAAGALSPTVAGTPADHDPGGRDHRRPGRDARRPDRRRADDADLDADYVQLPVRHRRPDLGLQLLRPRRRPALQAEHRRAGRRHPARPTRSSSAARRRCRAPRCRRRTSPAASALLLQAKPKHQRRRR